MNRDLYSDLNKLADAFYKGLIFNNRCEYGSPGLDYKRPFGSSCVELDILNIIGYGPEGADGDGDLYSEQQKEYARSLYSEKLVPYLKAKWEVCCIKPATPPECEQSAEVMKIVPLSLLKSVLEAAIDNHLECMNDHAAKNEGYMFTVKNRALSKVYEDEKADLDKLNNLVNGENHD